MECMPPKGSRNGNYGYFVLMMYPIGSLIVTSEPLWWEVLIGCVCACVHTCAWRVHTGTEHLMLNFAVKVKLLLKIKSI